ncbi:hypothetical protein [Salinimonas sediminis]|uniref:Uncharacterized protein n=1 Tax=Salinimonas sediminis TaxID=2303538 RepID=A0A346NQP4_9ALTE|nr:hypothetical protein [Salinimonas sediminis]AXR07851.1 hypothetical protein D0Y50_16695 [Salinimonas sediminis]
MNEQHTQLSNFLHTDFNDSTMQKIQLYQTQVELERKFKRLDETLKELDKKNIELNKLKSKYKLQIKRNDALSIAFNKSKHIELSLVYILRRFKIPKLSRAGRNLVALVSKEPSSVKPVNGDESDIELLLNSDYFDSYWYLNKYKDVDDAKVSPARHFLSHAKAELRNPSVKFSTLHYLRNNPDVALENINPLIHYLRFGRYEGRKVFKVL